MGKGKETGRWMRRDDACFLTGTGAPFISLASALMAGRRSYATAIRTCSALASDASSSSWRLIAGKHVASKGVRFSIIRLPARRRCASTTNERDNVLRQTSAFDSRCSCCSPRSRTSNRTRSSVTCMSPILRDGVHVKPASKRGGHLPSAPPPSFAWGCHPAAYVPSRWVRSRASAKARALAVMPAKSRASKP